MQLHADFEFEAAKTRARVRRGVTVPDEFNLSSGNKQESRSRRMRTLESKVGMASRLGAVVCRLIAAAFPCRPQKQQLIDILIDQEELPEQRWPFASRRGKVCWSDLPSLFC